MSYLKKVVTEQIRKYKYGTVFFSITKGELRTLPEEEKKILEPYIGGYYRGRNKLRPKSMADFIKQSKYEDHCRAEVLIPMDALVNLGILRVVEEGGLSYWYLYDEKLSPREYYNIYELRDDTFRTLITELGLEEFTKQFKTEKGNMNTLLVIDYGGLKYRLDYWTMTKTTLTVDTYIDYRTGSVTDTSDDNTIHAYIYVSYPEVNDVIKIKKTLDDLSADVKNKVEKIMSWLDSYLRAHLPVGKQYTFHISGSIEVSNYNIKYYRVEVKTFVELDSKSRLAVTAEYKFPDSLFVKIERSIGSEYLTKALLSLRMSGAIWHEKTDGEAKYILEADKFRRSSTLRYIGEFKVQHDLGNLPDIGRQFNVVFNMKSILNRAMLEEVMNMNQNILIEDDRYTTSLDLTPRKIFEIVGWREGQSAEESVMKVWLIRVLTERHASHRSKIKPDVVSIAYSLAYLGGAPYDYVMDRVKRGLEYIIELVMKGRMKIRESGVYIDGAPTGIDMNNKYVRKIVELLTLLTSTPTHVEEEYSGTERDLKHHPTSSPP